MLDRIKLHVQLAQKNLVLEQKQEDFALLIRQVWDLIGRMPQFKQESEEAESFFTVPSWIEDLQKVHRVMPSLSHYTILGVDGSQIYPDRHHMYVGNAVINVGGMGIAYGKEDPVTLFSEPEVVSLYRYTQEQERVLVTAQWIDLEREMREYEKSFEYAVLMKEKTGEFPVILFDGTLLSYHLLALTEKDRFYFFHRISTLFKKFREMEILYGSYLSAPSTTDLVHLLKLGLCRFKRANCKSCYEIYREFPCARVDTISDRMVVQTVIPQGCCTTFFKPARVDCLSYLEQDQPYFLYYHGEKEVGRIELPAWIIHSTTMRERVLSYIVDQIQKGHGYPLILAEAHEQAVIKQHDKEYFYQLCAYDATLHNIALYRSEKSLKKKQMPF